jgi:hypothetical protein
VNHIKKSKWALAGVAMLTCVAASESASAISFGVDFKGYVTMLAQDGSILRNTTPPAGDPFDGYRTPVTGKMVLDIGLLGGLSGTATIDPIFFFGSNTNGRDISFKPVSTLLNIPTSTLLLGNLSFDFGTIPSFQGIPVSIVLDLGNLTTALMGSSLGDIVGGLLTAPSENTVVGTGESARTYPMGPVVVATTTWNTTDVDTNGDGVPGPVMLGTNPSGTTPLIVDVAIDTTTGEVGIGGSPIKASGFATFSPNFDFKEITVTCINLLASCANGGIPVPPLPLNPDPLAPLLGGASKLLKGLGL